MSGGAVANSSDRRELGLRGLVRWVDDSIVVTGAAPELEHAARLLDGG
jgi:hypothetical protein